MPKKAKSSTGKRYTSAQKKQILTFIAKQGRGGISKAKKRWGVSYIAISRWQKLGTEGTPKLGRPTKAGKGSTASDKKNMKLVSLALKIGARLTKEIEILEEVLSALP